MVWVLYLQLLPYIYSGAPLRYGENRCHLVNTICEILVLAVLSVRLEIDIIGYVAK
jgi:hypothetical protein